MRKKKEPTFAYGIEITKPFSKEMYDHNDMVAKEMKSNILKAWESALDELFNGYSKQTYMESDWNFIKEDTKLVKLQKGICYSGFGDGFTIGDVDKEFRSEVENMPNYQLHESYSYLAFESMLPRTSFMLIGFDWEKFDYHVIGSQELTSPAVVVNKVVDELMKDSLDA